MSLMPKAEGHDGTSEVREAKNDEIHCHSYGKQWKGFTQGKDNVIFIINSDWELGWWGDQVSG